MSISNVATITHGDAPLPNAHNPDWKPAGIPDDDPDAIALAQARAEIEAEAGNTPAPKPVEQPPADQVAAAQEVKPEQTAPAPKPDQGKRGGPMIPKERFDEVRQQAAYWKGVAEGRASNQPQTEAAPVEQAKPADPLAEIEAKRLALADRFDAGEIGMKQYAQESGALDREVIRIAAETAKAAVPQQQPADDLFLDQITADLEAKHPYATMITAPEDWAFIEAKAAAALKEAGVRLDQGPRSDLALRQKMAELTDVYGPTLTGKTLQPQPQQPVPNGQKPGLSPSAQAHKDKLELAARMPPDVSSLGATGAGKGEVTEADIERMTEEEIAALPRSIRDRIFLGKSG